MQMSPSPCPGEERGQDEELQFYLLSNWNYIFKNAPLDTKLPGSKKVLLLPFIEELVPCCISFSQNTYLK